MPHILSKTTPFLSLTSSEKEKKKKKNPVRWSLSKTQRGTMPLAQHRGAWGVTDTALISWPGLQGSAQIPQLRGGWSCRGG